MLLDWEILGRKFLKVRPFHFCFSFSFVFVFLLLFAFLFASNELRYHVGSTRLLWYVRGFPPSYLLIYYTRMNGGRSLSMAASSTAEDRVSSLCRSSSVSFTAGMGIDLREPYWVPFSSKVLGRNSVDVP